MPDVFVASEDKAKKKPHRKAKRHTTHGHVPDQVSGNRARAMNPFKAYMYKPYGIHFENQQNGEEVMLLLRRHIITNVPWILIALLMILAPLVLPFFPIISFLPVNFQAVALIMWYLITFAFILESFLIWFFNASIITDRRIIDIDFHNLIYKEVSDTEIDQIQDVTYKMGGVVRTVFNYGDVFVQTASEVPNFEFLAVPRPDEVSKLLQRLREHH